MKRIFGLALAAASFAIIPSAGAQERVQLSGGLVTGPILLLETPVAIACKNPGSSQDVAKTPWLTNNTAAKIPAGKTVFFKASDGDSGSQKLAADLLPGASVKMMGAKAGQVYTCTGSFNSQADLVVSKASMGMAAAMVDIANQNPWVDASANPVRIDIINCSGNTIQKTVYSTPLAVPHASVRTVTIPVTSVGRTYFKVYADGKGMVAETNEGNNVYTSSLNSCLY
jgi:hypothetical protein